MGGRVVGSSEKGTEKGKCRNTKIGYRKIENVKKCKFSRYLWYSKQSQIHHSKHAQPSNTIGGGGVMEIIVGWGQPPSKSDLYSWNTQRNKISTKPLVVSMSCKIHRSLAIEDIEILYL